MEDESIRPSTSAAATRSGAAARTRPAPLARGLDAHLRASGLLHPGDAVLVAVSGGVDSLVLLHLLRFALADWRFRLAAAHLDHRMRPGSDADARWLAGLCRAWGIPLERGVAGEGLRAEAAAREARYRFLHDAAARRGATAIATAHQLDDQAETVLFRAARGTGLAGLAGIPARRGDIVRPLLPFRRAEIEAYARGARLRWLEDPTNSAADFARNRIRREILPVLEELAPGAAPALARLAERAREAEEAWDALAASAARDVVISESEGAAELARTPFLGYPSEVQARVLRSLLRRHGSAPGRAGTRAALEFISSCGSGAQLHLPGGVRLQREFDRFVVEAAPRPDTREERPALLPGAASGKAEAVVGGCRFAVLWGPGLVGEAGDSAAFDPAAIHFPLELRSWRPGDRLRLATGTKKLKKLFAERRVPRSARAHVPIVAEVGGRVLWAVGVARASEAEPSSRGPVLHITVRNAEHG
ncbi:MAG TPA: tRNA lysidine(34) synthetase TilS [Longimicrobiales bacterium]|nr:tRNA lysidine(34) synthetase TilS [Longimicrobiales bacterium]